MTSAADLRFEPPGKGQWVSLRDHFPRAVTAEYASLLPVAMAEGEAVPFAQYGLPVKTLTVSLVNGHVYVAPAPLVGPPGSALPPRMVLWAAVRLVPAFRRRTRAAQRALDRRPWIAEAEHWYATERSEWISSNLALQDEDPASMLSAHLVDHLARAGDHAATGYRRHFALHGPDLMPTGLLLARCEDWGIPAAEVLPALHGCSPASLGSGPELAALRHAIGEVGAEPATIDEVEAAAPAELAAFLRLNGWRLVTGYDVDSRALIELPGLVVTLARSAPPAPQAGDGAALDDLRSRVPSHAVAELEQLVADARLTFGMRDDNGGLTGAWPMGLLRRGMLAAGRRLAGAGLLHEADHALEATVDELRALLDDRGGPSADVLAERASERQKRSQLVPPLQLGPSVDLPLSVLPPAMRLMSRAQLLLRDSFTAPLDERADLEGDGIGASAYQGRACVATDPADALARMEPGDVLVALGTTPAFNMALSIAGAVVVEEGGLLSHAAVIARELGLPALVGAAGAMAAIPDGALVEVDPAVGRVRVLAAG
ncbi:MAG: PEP-utilizing enzyme [Actinomycetota bacterium]